MSVAHYFNISPKEGYQIIAEVKTAIAKWKSVAKKLGIPAPEIIRMESAFSP